MRALSRLSVIAVASLSTLVAAPLTPASAGKSGGSATGNVFRTANPGSGVSLKNKLVVFIPGTNLTPAQSTGFLENAASQGFHAVGLAYDNKKSVAKVCKKEADACFGQVRREIVFGENLSARVNISVANSLVGRLKTQLQTLAAGSDNTWDQYLDASGQVVLSKVVASGHSQGAGHAAILAIYRSVAGVALLAGPNDVVRQTGDVPSWTSTSRSTTSSVWRGLTHTDDNSRTDQTSSWDNFGMGGSAPARQVVSGSTSNPHFSVVVDGSLLSGINAKWNTLLASAAPVPAAVSTSVPASSPVPLTGPQKPAVAATTPGISAVTAA